MFPETGESVRMPRHYTFLRRLPTTCYRFGGLCMYVNFGLCERPKFYCEINYFICE